MLARARMKSSGEEGWNEVVLDEYVYLPLDHGGDQDGVEGHQAGLTEPFLSVAEEATGEWPGKSCL